MFYDKNKGLLDKGDLTQVMIIVAGFATTAVVAIAGIASVALNKGESAASCIAGASTLKAGHASKVRCEDYEETAREKSNAAIIGNFGNASASDKVIELTDEAKKEASMKKELKEFHEVLEDYKKEHGEYPVGTTPLRSLNYRVNTDIYPADEYNWNFEYCPSLDGKEFVHVTYAGDGKIFYVTSNNKNPHEITLKREDQQPFMRDGKDTGGVISPCYSGTEYSIADRVGLGQIGEFNEDKTELIGGIGSTGINHTGGQGFAQTPKGAK